MIDFLKSLCRRSWAAFYFLAKVWILVTPTKKTQCDSYKGLFSNQLDQSLHIVRGKKIKIARFRQRGLAFRQNITEFLNFYTFRQFLVASCRCGCCFACCAVSARCIVDCSSRTDILSPWFHIPASSNSWSIEIAFKFELEIILGAIEFRDQNR